MVALPVRGVAEPSDKLTSVCHYNQNVRNCKTPRKQREPGDATTHPAAIITCRIAARRLRRDAGATGQHDPKRCRIHGKRWWPFADDEHGNRGEKGKRCGTGEPFNGNYACWERSIRSHFRLVWVARRREQQRSLQLDLERRACLHAKCVVVDRLDVYVSSANFTEAAQERNIEVGLLARSRRLAQQLTNQLDALLDAGLLRQVICF